MAQPAANKETIEHARALYRAGENTRRITVITGLGYGTMYGYITSADKKARSITLTEKREREDAAAHNPTPISATPAPPVLPAAKHEVYDLVELPEPFHQSYFAYKIDKPGHWGVISDIHLPYHDRTTLELFVAECKRRKVVGILLNGDTLDSHEVSDHDKDPSAPRYVEEIETGKKLLAWFRGQFQRSEIFYKVGNHEERLERYIIRRAPALFGVEGLTVEGLLHLEQLGIEYVTDRRVIELGKLNVIHGHEYRGGVSSPVNPARGLYLKARSVALAGHHHQTSEHHAKDIRERAEAAWSTGCACYLSPMYLRKNNWNHGFAFVELDSAGDFIVENKRVHQGKIV